MIRKNVKLLPMKKQRTSKRESYLKKIGQNIRKARREKGMSQESLALAADLDRSYVGGVERGERNISVVNMKKIADALEVSASILIGGL